MRIWTQALKLTLYGLGVWFRSRGLCFFNLNVGLGLGLRLRWPSTGVG